MLPNFSNSWHFWLPAIILFVALVWALAVPIFEAWLDYKGRPREPMEWCHKHGFFRKTHCIPITPTVNVCPTCYLDAIGGAGKVKKP